jgi:hypothetical protein
MAKAVNEAALDELSNAMIYEGASITQLSRLFRLDKKGIPAKLRGVKPSGERAGYDIYNIAEVAPLLVKWEGDPTERIKRMNHMDLPPLLQKAFWDGQQARIRFEKEEGELWPTDQIAEFLGEFFQTVRLTWLTLPDEVERRSVLTEEQRNSIRSYADRKLEELRVRLNDVFTRLQQAERDREDSLEEAAGSPEVEEEEEGGI